MKPRRRKLNLWMAFANGVIAAAIAWLIVHGGGLMGNSAKNIEYENQEEAIQTPEGDSTADTNQASSNANRAAGANADNGDQPGAPAEKYNQPVIRVYLTDFRVIEKVPLETYVRGVVAAEMPLDFEPAALEAQAMAARTYIIRRLWLEDRTGNPVDNVDVTDTQTHQVYRSLSEMKRLLSENEQGWRKVDKAVSKTAGEIIVYRDQPIEALFFSTSNGYTENSEEVFPAKLPYLRSVASPWDKEASPRARETVEMALTDFYAKLGLKTIPVNIKLQEQANIRILEWTDGRRVKQMLAGGKKLTGEEVRHRLGLRSASFDLKISNNRVILTTYGSGHGVGMSQWGAEGMAKAGKTANQIVEYYYSGTRTEKVSKLVNSTGKRL
ncbi:stage II sporulation protein D [Cohnella silvisoli]|uniref:Stage II sporulation protein D n=1 Tax=Cohnella silvisoli TaxID=2873699 RepID=A0ABV1KPU2_9BACL|nr:stage II sporulation protein D [Cohnella silvisoli]